MRLSTSLTGGHMFGVRFRTHGNGGAGRSLKPTPVAPEPTSVVGDSLSGFPRLPVPCGPSAPPLHGSNCATVAGSGVEARLPPEDLSPTTHAYSQDEVDERMALIRADADAATLVEKSRGRACIPSTAPIE